MNSEKVFLGVKKPLLVKNTPNGFCPSIEGYFPK
jgi:hypothetical protein